MRSPCQKALLRPLDEPNADPYYAALEKELLDAINATGFGPQGFGGATTCLGVAIEQKPTHVACLPVAVNISCHVTRRASRRCDRCRNRPLIFRWTKRRKKAQPAQERKASRIDIPLDEDGKRAEPLDITMAELEFVNRHHEEYKELRRRAREQEGR